MAGSDKRFMVDERILDEIVGYAGLEPGDVVLEFGGGTGALTERIAQKARVMVIEKDRGLSAGLAGRFKGNDAVTVIQGDALRVDWPPFGKVVSNVPYSVSRGLLERMVPHGFGLAVLTLQREFADKLSAAPSSDNYRMVSVLAQSSCRVELLREVPPEAFDPRPRVSSTVVRLTQTWVPPRGYIGFLNRLFSGKNKKVRNIMEASEAYSQRKVSDMGPGEFRSLFLEAGGAA